MVYIFDKFDKISDENYQFLYNLLPPSRKTIADQRSGINKKIAIVEYFYLKMILKFEGLPDFEYSENGKPRLAGYNFSLSHSGHILCVATAENEVGVDIEKKIECKERLARFMLNEGEFDALQAEQDKDYAITKMWVKKEAAIKCLGKKLSDIKDILNETRLVFTIKEYGKYMIAECQKKN